MRDVTQQNRQIHQGRGQFGNLFFPFHQNRGRLPFDFFWTPAKTLFQSAPKRHTFRISFRTFKTVQVKTSTFLAFFYFNCFADGNEFPKARENEMKGWEKAQKIPLDKNYANDINAFWKNWLVCWVNKIPEYVFLFDHSFNCDLLVVWIPACRFFQNPFFLKRYGRLDGRSQLGLSATECVIKASVGVGMLYG